jgi:adenylate kinase
MYGKGEQILNEHFKKGWLQEPARLPYVGEGKNLVPTVHVVDLARMVKKVFESKPEK